MPDYMQILNSLHPALSGYGQGSGMPGQDMNQTSTTGTSDDPFLSLLSSTSKDAADSAPDTDSLTTDANPSYKQTGGRIKLPPRDKKMRRPEITPAQSASLLKQIAALGPVQPFKDQSKKDQKGLVIAAPNNENFYPDILALGSHFGFSPSNPDPKSGEIMGINSPKSHTSRRDPHFYGQAVDFSIGNHSNAEIDYFIQQAIANGYSVEDVRRPKRGGAHIHIQSTYQPTGRYMYNDGTYMTDENGHKHYHAMTPPSFVKFDYAKGKAGLPMRPVPPPPRYQHLTGINANDQSLADDLNSYNQPQ